MIRTEPTIGRLGGAPSCLPMFKQVLRQPSELARLTGNLGSGTHFSGKPVYRELAIFIS